MRMGGEAARAAHISLRGISKNYGGVRAVRDVDLELARGSVHAIVGENGAGKSTLSKIIAGVISPSDGEMFVDGARVAFHAPRQALDRGIAMIEQELSLVSSRSVMNNVFLGVESRRGPMVDKRAQRARFRELLDRTGFKLDADAKVSTLRVADQQKVEILRALARDARFIIMDEPTAPLTQVESEQLYEIIRGLRDGGTTILYISHFLDEVLAISDTVTVMRDGAHVSTKPAAQETTATLVTAMLGRSLDLAFPARQRCDESRPPILEVRGLTAAGRFQDISFSLRPGEIVGVAGLIGSGRTEMLRAVAGADHFGEGEILVDGESVRWRSPRDAIDHGIVMLPESRKHDGLVMVRTIAENTVMPRLDRVSTLGVLRRGAVRTAARQMMADLDVRATGPDAKVTSLSGGNQQKVLFGKCLMGGPRVLLVDEPTRGVDVGAKRAIYELLVSLAARGMALMVVSSELEEILGLAHRVLVMRQGRIVAELSAAEASEEAILAAAFGAAAAA